MKTSEVINNLQDLIDKNGDLPFGILVEEHEGLLIMKNKFQFDSDGETHNYVEMT